MAVIRKNEKGNKNAQTNRSTLDLSEVDGFSSVCGSINVLITPGHLIDSALARWYSEPGTQGPGTQKLSLQEPDALELGAQESSTWSPVLRILVLGTWYSGAQYSLPSIRPPVLRSLVLGAW